MSSFIDSSKDGEDIVCFCVSTRISFSVESEEVDISSERVDSELEDLKDGDDDDEVVVDDKVVVVEEEVVSLGSLGSINSIQILRK